MDLAQVDPDTLISEAGAIFLGLKKYDGALTPEANRSLQSAIDQISKYESKASEWIPKDGVAGYLSTGIVQQKHLTINTAASSLSQLLAVGVPLPRKSKDELQNLKRSLSKVKISIPEDRCYASARLRELLSEAVNQQKDLDVVEREVDETVRSVLRQLHGTEELQIETLQMELKWLSEGQKRCSTESGGPIYGLVLNALERLHASQFQQDGDSDDEKSEFLSEEDGEDPFYMPLPTTPLELAQKYKILAEPLRPDQPQQDKPILELTETPPETTNQSTGPDTAPSDAVQSTSEGENTRRQESAGVDGASATPDGEQSSGEPSMEDDLDELSNFLSSDNPKARLFHAQMRLSLKGCEKLAAFLANSSRVKAVSLSYNFIGDEGVAAICKGLRRNKTVTAIDLPSNDISDFGAIQIAEAISHNRSLTQLDLGSNRIGDAGAQALAKVIKSNNNLAKIGLSNNNIGKPGSRALAAAVRTNHSIKHVQLLPGNPVDEDDARALAKAIKRNKKFSIRKLLELT